MNSDEKKLSILIVDDDSFLLDMYAIKFRQSGFDVKTALGSVSAVEILEEGLVPDVLLLDIVMPTMDGFEMLAKINEKGLIKDTVKIFLSNRGAPTDLEEGKKLGASQYIVKANNTPSEVVAKVDEVLKEHGLK